MIKEIPTYSLKSLFESSDTYVIPIYQRNYAWGEGQVNQLIQDIYDFAFDPIKNKNQYYIGTLVVNEIKVDNELFYETIDGQQRLTTLNLVMAAVHHIFGIILNSKIEYSLNLTFSSRKSSSETLGYICSENFNGTYISNKDFNPAIQNRYKDIVKTLRKLLGDDENIINTFYQYLTSKVQVVRVSVPEETDLNHYFEIMNNRGEQLEKHEILKAKMLEVLKNDEKLTIAFSKIWDACSDMERYVQYGFVPEERDRIFTFQDWNTLRCNSLECVSNKLETDANKDDKSINLSSIITSQSNFSHNKEHDKEAPERFTSVINFQNFLLQVLKIQTQARDASFKNDTEKGDNAIKKRVSLDDKRLIDFFDPYLKQDEEESLKFVKDFGFNLLKKKHLFDQYIIKREVKGEKEDWSLKRLKWYQNNRVNYVNAFGSEEEENQLNQENLMLLAMFHVSTPTMVYKHWLNAALFYLFNQTEEINAESYSDYLKQIAEAYLYGRYICKKENMLEYYDIIYKKEETVVIRDRNELLMERLNKGTSVENFVFNYLDFLLWKRGGNSGFKYSSNNSIEHHYPQNPPDVMDKLEDKYLHGFGNLSIMSSSKNSRFTNNMPEAKVKNFKLEKDSDSLKMQEMFKITNEKGWKAEQILEHGSRMIKVLLQEDYDKQN